jgi:Type IV pilin-like G and H, putative
VQTTTSTSGRPASRSYQSWLMNKVSDGVELPERVSFMATNNNMAKREVFENIQTVLSAQQEYRSKNPQYSESFSQLRKSADLTNVNTSYRYQMNRLDAQRLTVTAIPKNNQLPVYIGMIYSQNGQNSRTIVCSQRKPQRSIPGNPIASVKNNKITIRCSKGTIENEW